MTNEAIVELIQNGQGDRSDLLGTLYEQNRGLIQIICKRYSRGGDFEDLMQEAYFGLETAARLYDSEHGAGFMRYASFWIKSVVVRYLDNSGDVIRIPVHQRQRILNYNRAVSRFMASEGRDPSPKELEELLSITGEQVEELKRDAQLLQTGSLTEITGEDLELMDSIPADYDLEGEALEKYDQEKLSRLLWSLVDELKDQEKEVLRLRFQEAASLSKTGEAMGVSPER